MGLPQTSPARDRSRSGHISELRRLREQVKVAAVCYRLGRKGIEFLLVQTRGSGRWTFPKGGIERGLTHAQAAALEAYEEAGVHGRMEDTSFSQYVRREGNRRDSRSEVVKAHLCEVSWLELPEEAGRYPTWFSPKTAKRRLREGRSADFGSEIACVVDRAVERIQRPHNPDRTSEDALHRVQFEALGENAIHTRLQQGRFSSQVYPAHRATRSAGAIELAVRAQLSKVLQFVPPQEIRQDRTLLQSNANDFTPASVTSRANRLGRARK
jgi:8-oxo-dGTP pyrophosphatase MutT (NUDIX family)